MVLEELLNRLVEFEAEADVSTRFTERELLCMLGHWSDDGEDLLRRKAFEGSAPTSDELVLRGTEFLRNGQVSLSKLPRLRRVRQVVAALKSAKTEVDLEEAVALAKDSEERWPELFGH